MADLTLDWVNQEAGQEQGRPAGWYAAGAPRRAARLRAQDRLMLFFAQSGTAPLSPHVQQEMLSRLAETYFTAAGSVTSGMRVTAERLNEFLLNRNLRAARQGGQVIGNLAMAVMHGETIYLLLVGAVQVFALSARRSERFGDAAARGLGQARVVAGRYFTIAVEADLTLLFAAPTAPDWPEDTLQSWCGLAIDELRARLAQSALDVQAGLVRLQPGRGEVRWLRMEPARQSAASNAPASVASGGQVSGHYLSGKPLVAGGTLPEKAVEVPETPPSEPPIQRRDSRPPEGASLPQRPKPARPVRERHVLSPAWAAAAGRLAGAIAWLRARFAWLREQASRLAARVLPDQPAAGLNLSPSTMLFIALAVPLMVTAVAATVYFQRGRGEQYRAYLRTAAQFAEQAAAAGDEALRREDWNQTLAWLDKAAGYGHSEEADQLRQQAQHALDEMEGIVRLNYLPAGSPLPEGVVVTRMVATISDVYLLDGQIGQVYRLFRTSQGYELDSRFTCGPGKAGAVIIGPLLDIAPLPPVNEFKATVAGIDAGGNLVFCAPGVSGFSSMTLIPPDINWGAISRMTIFQDTLYVLDAKVNAVYRYFRSDGMLFASPPRLYFDNQIPHMTDVIDMAVDQEYLYLLHQDGSMTTCSASGFTTECTDPAPYGDSRHGRVPDPLTFEDARFIRMQTTQPPDPSLYILDDRASSIYHFSLRKLNLQRQYRPQVEPEYPLPAKAATAFVITPNRRALLAFGNRIFYAPLP
ncbi:MAG TPA: hypothetical protein DEQ80_02300 [Anaerolinea thermolimosa]|uniref:Uncharacterized protein n=1 Tax=Anaerolinea thermolimosa TaxID=229919 RepID=A0A3D1JDL5_9CHLR|nr:hypothetical protein [Anaerolinea thermolimosa]